MTVKKIVAYIVLGLFYVGLYWGVPALLCITGHDMSGYLRTVGFFHLWTVVYIILSFIGRWALENVFKK